MSNPELISHTNLYALTAEQVAFIVEAMRGIIWQGTAEQLRPTIALVDSITAALHSPAEVSGK